MNVLLFGATGMVGQGVLRECLLDPSVERVQVVGRSSQNKTVNFTTTSPILPALGSYQKVRITQTFPNSLLAEAI